MNISAGKAPDWRFDQAKTALLMQRQEQSLPNTQDAVVAFLYRLISSEESKGALLFVKNKMPQLYAIYKLGAKQNQSPMRCQLQAAILSFQSNQQILQKVSWLTQLQLCFYKDAFFDVDQLLTEPAWIQQFLLQPLRRAHRFQLYSARMLALNGSYRDAFQSIPWGRLTQKGQSILRKYYKKAHVKRMFKYFLRDVSMDPVTQANIMNGHFVKEQEAEQQKQLRASAAGDSSQLNELAQGIQKYIKGFSRQECQQGADNPQDDSNETIKHIIAESKEAQKKEAVNEQQN